MGTIKWIGVRLKEERERLGLSQQEAARYAGVRREMWAKYEAGAEPGANVLSRLIAQGIDLHYVLTGENGVALTQDEKKLLHLYRESPPVLRDAVIRVLDIKEGNYDVL